MSSPELDTRFALPAVDDLASTEIGVILMGLEADRLLAGLGLAALADDPTLVTMVVDQARHDALRGITAEALLELGISRWGRVRGALPEVARSSAGLRQLWTKARQAVDEAEVGELGPASRAYLAACWLRRAEVDRLLEAHRVPEVTP